MKLEELRARFRPRPKSIVQGRFTRIPEVEVNIPSGLGLPGSNARRDYETWTTSFGAKPGFISSNLRPIVARMGWPKGTGIDASIDGMDQRCSVELVHNNKRYAVGRRYSHSDVELVVYRVNRYVPPSDRLVDVLNERMDKLKHRVPADVGLEAYAKALLTEAAASGDWPAGTKIQAAPGDGSTIQRFDLTCATHTGIAMAEWHEDRGEMTWSITMEPA